MFGRTPSWIFVLILLIGGFLIYKHQAITSSSQQSTKSIQRNPTHPLHNVVNQRLSPNQMQAFQDMQREMGNGTYNRKSSDEEYNQRMQDTSQPPPNNVLSLPGSNTNTNTNDVSFGGGPDFDDDGGSVTGTGNAPFSANALAQANFKPDDPCGMPALGRHPIDVNSIKMNYK